MRPEAQAGEIAGAALLTEWMAASKPFRAFAETYRSKIEKKLRAAPDAESLRDVLLELEVAFCLLWDRRVAIEYEKDGTGRMRAPDFTVTFRTRAVFHLEVTRWRAASGENGDRLTRLVCNKLGQMPPRSPNVLAIAPEGAALTAQTIAEAMQQLKRRVEKDAEAAAALGFADTPGFFRQFRRLSAILLWQADAPRALWRNPQAANPLPAEIAALLLSPGVANPRLDGLRQPGL